MITKDDLKNMILSHPANVMSKYKLSLLNKTELNNYLDELNGEDIEGPLLYSDYDDEDLNNDYKKKYENNYENTHEYNKSTDPLNDLYKDYNKCSDNDDDDDNEDEDEYDDTLTLSQFNKKITELKNKIINNSDNDIEGFLDKINNELNNYMDSCPSLTKAKQNKIFDDFEKYTEKCY